MTTELTTVDIPYSLRREIAAYCSHSISPQQYYLHNAIGGEGWDIRHDPNIKHSKYSSTGNWVVECTPHYATIIRLKFGSV